MSSRDRARICPEVVQTSAMDCGPASLKAVLEGFGIHVSYERLRESCQTDIDGTSIDALEQVAGQLGLDAEQVMIPSDHFLLPEAEALPAIVVVLLPGGLTHFVVVWRRHGPWLQVMDPGVGRIWVRGAQFLRDLFIHEMPIPAEAFQAWAADADFQAPFRVRLKAIKLDSSTGESIFATLAEAKDWRMAARYDAALRFVESLCAARALPRGKAAKDMLLSLIARLETDEAASFLPAHYWTARPTEAIEDEPQVLLRGMVLLKLAKAEKENIAETPEAKRLLETVSAEKKSLYSDLIRMVMQEGRKDLPGIMLTIVLIAMAVLTESLLFRSLLAVGQDLNRPEQRVLMLILFVSLSLAILLLQMHVFRRTFLLGRHFEIKLRQGFLAFLPRIPDSYFQSRLTSDMTERSHNLQGTRNLYELLGEIVQALAFVVFTTAGLIWMDPGNAVWLIAAVILMIGLPLLFQPVLVEQDLKLRSHSAGLFRYNLDVFLGLIPIRTHSAQRVVRREHESLLTDWARANLQLVGTTRVVRAVDAIVSVSVLLILMYRHVSTHALQAEVLLFTYWLVRLSTLGLEISQMLMQLPALRNLILRAEEPMRQEAVAEAEEKGKTFPSGGLALDFQQVTVLAAGRPVLEDITVSIAPGEHIAIVGASGAGKSSLVGLLLGWYPSWSGSVKVSGDNLNADTLEALRRTTAWVDPSVQIWQESLFENLLYGHDRNRDVSDVIEEADLRTVLQSLPEGLRTSLGESGALLSGGEGQRVRLGRALLKDDASLVILDEAFRGLDRKQRSRLLNRVRDKYRDSTLLCVSHDVRETADFSRVLVIHEGRVVEDDVPRALLDRDGSFYRKMMEAEESLHKKLWEDTTWRHLYVHDGRVEEKGELV